MEEYRKYSIRKNRFRRSFLSGLEMEGEGGLRCAEGAYRRMLISSPIDGITEGANWGRLHLEWDLEPDMVITAYAAAMDVPAVWRGEKQVSIAGIFYDAEIPLEEKKRMMESLGAKKAVNQQDILLYELEGRYFYLLLDIQGYGNGRLSKIWVDNQGDQFMDTFPDVYREYGGFFHRYLSIFSSLYMDFQEKIDCAAELMDIDTAPVELLPIFGRWMGLDVSEGNL